MPVITEELIISKASAEPLLFLDARPVEDAGEDFVNSVLQALRKLPNDGVLKLLTRNRPASLLEQLANNGYRLSARQGQEGAWDIEIVSAAAPDIADLRELEAPEPMHRVLLAASRLEGNQTYYVRLPHVPHPLFPLLKERGLRWWVHEERDQSALLAVRAGT